MNEFCSAMKTTVLSSPQECVGWKFCTTGDSESYESNYVVDYLEPSELGCLEGLEF